MGGPFTATGRQAAGRGGAAGGRQGSRGLVWPVCADGAWLAVRGRTCTVVAPQSRRKSAGVRRGRTKQRTSYPSSNARRTTCGRHGRQAAWVTRRQAAAARKPQTRAAHKPRAWRPSVPVAPTTSMEVDLTGVPPVASAAAAVTPSAGVRESDTAPDCRRGDARRPSRSPRNACELCVSVGARRR